MSFLSGFNDAIPTGVHCSICSNEMRLNDAFVQTSDIPIVCKACWPFYVQATLLCQLVFRSDMGKGKRTNHEK
jgi:hypothetical protein